MHMYLLVTYFEYVCFCVFILKIPLKVLLPSRQKNQIAIKETVL